MTTNSTDIDAVGTLITTEFGGPPQSQPVPARNFQAYGAGLKNVYPYLYDPTDFVPPLDESEGGLALQEQEWVGEVEYIQANDPEYLEGADITADVPFENPLDTLSAADTSLAARSAGENVVDYDLGEDVAVGPVAYGVEEETTEVVAPDAAVAEAQAEDEAFSAPATEQTETSAPVVAPVAPVEDPTALPGQE